MADVSVLREYLVKLGFDVDKAKLKKFTDAVEESVKRITLVGVAMGAAATAVAAGVTKIGNQYDQLYFAAQRLKSTTETVDALRKGMYEVAGSSSLVTNALEAFSATGRRFPTVIANMVGNAGFGRVKLDTKDYGQTLLNLLDVWKQVWETGPRGQITVMARAGLLGIDPDTVDALIKNLPELHAAVQRNRDLNKMLGLDEKSADVAHQFMVQIRAILDVFNKFGSVIGLRFFADMQKTFSLFWTELGKNPAALQASLKGVADWLANVATSIAIFLIKAIEFFSNLDHATGGLSTKLIVLATLLHFTGIDRVFLTLIGLVGQLGSSFLGLVAAGGPIALVIAGIAAIGAAILLIDWTPFTKQLQQVQDAFGQLGAAINDAWKDISNGQSIDWHAIFGGALTLVAELLTGLTNTIRLLDALQHVRGHVDSKGNLTITGWDDVTKYAGATGLGDPNMTAARRAAAGTAAMFGRRGGAPEGAPGAPSALASLATGLGTIVKPLFTQPSASADAKDTKQHNELTDLLQQILHALGGAASAAGGAVGGAAQAIGNVAGQVAASVGPAALDIGRQIVGTLKSVPGMSDVAAIAGAAVSGAESSWRPHVEGPMTKYGRAAGLFQLLGDRRKAFEKQFGVDVTQSTVEQQLQYLLQELSQTKVGQNLLGQLQGARTIDEAVKAWIHIFENPGAAGEKIDYRNAMRYLQQLSPSFAPGGQYERALKATDQQLYQPSSYSNDNSRTVTMNPTTHITVEGSADPHATARNVAFEQSRVHGDLVRNAKALIV